MKLKKKKIKTNQEGGCSINVVVFGKKSCVVFKTSARSFLTLERPLRFEVKHCLTHWLCDSSLRFILCVSLIIIPFLPFRGSVRVKTKKYSHH